MLCNGFVLGIFRQSGIEMQLGLCMRLIRKHQCHHSYGFCLLEPKFGGGERETKGEGLLIKLTATKVTSVGSTREVIYVLNCEEASINIVLAEADLPMANSMKILKYITQDQELRYIPVIRQHLHDRKVIDAWSDYLMMPLGSNVLFNLWTHVWRTIRMLGLPEKNIFHLCWRCFWKRGHFTRRGVLIP